MTNKNLTYNFLVIILLYIMMIQRKKRKKNNTKKTHWKEKQTSPPHSVSSHHNTLNAIFVICHVYYYTLRVKHKIHKLEHTNINI